MMANPGLYKTAAQVEALGWFNRGSTAETGPNGQVTIPNLLEGFYWVIENPKANITGSKAVPFGLSLPFTNQTGDGYLEKIYVYPKNTLDAPPVIDKKVDEENVAIGQLNTWTITIDLPVGVEDYKEFKFFDEIDRRLDFEGVGSVEVRLDDVLLPSSAYDAVYTNYTLEVDFTNKSALKDGKQVVVTFQTRVNDTAIMGQDIENNVILDFDNSHGTIGQTEPDKPPYVHPGGKAFKKIDQGTEEGLEGAEFKIIKAEGRYSEYDSEYVIIGAGGAVTFGLEADAHVFISDSSGHFEVKGLPYGEYVLVEIKAPKGYALPTNRETDFVVDATSFYNDPTGITTPDTPSDNVMDINNMKMTIPQTGGIGTAIFTAVGIVFILFAVGYYRRTEQS